MARVTGLEPATSGVTGRRSNQLSYTRVHTGRQTPANARASGVVQRVAGVKRTLSTRLSEPDKRMTRVLLDFERHLVAGVLSAIARARFQQKTTAQPNLHGFR